jgi:hypothetical protein
MKEVLQSLASELGENALDKLYVCEKCNKVILYKMFESMRQETVTRPPRAP